MNPICIDIIVEKILDNKPGQERLISSIINMVPSNTSKPSRNEVKKYLDNLKTNEKEFISAMKKRMKQIGGDGGKAFFFSSIRKRAINYFSNKGNKK